LPDNKVYSLKNNAESGDLFFQKTWMIFTHDAGISSMKNLATETDGSVANDLYFQIIP